MGSRINSNFDSYWNQVTPGNGGKWGTVERIGIDVYDWGEADQAYSYALIRRYPFKYHTLVWGQQQPGWITTLDSASQYKQVEEWIRLVGNRYPLMDCIDVVNEPLPSHAPPPYARALGGNGSTRYDWVIKAFQLARQYCAPEVKLILNDYNIINSDGNTTELLYIINLLQTRDLIDGIGVQCHHSELVGVPNTTLTRNLDRLAATGLPIYISEFEVDEADDAQQVAEYQRLFPLLWEHPGVTGITLWGFVEGEIWRVNGYLIRADGSERPALQWLRTYLTTGNFQSFQSGNWNDVRSWARYNDTAWIHPAPYIPTVADAAITIQNGHAIAVTADDTVDQLTVASGGILSVAMGTTLLVSDGIGMDLTVFGTVRNSGSITKRGIATIGFLNGASYTHELNGGSIPTATWGINSICEIDSVISAAPSNGSQDFFNVIWNCPNQTGNLNMGWDGITIGGNITINSTGTGQWQMCAPAAGASATVNITGNVIQTNGQFTTNDSSNTGTSVIINHAGNITVTGGDFSISRGTQGGTGTTVWNLTNGNVSLTDATTQNSNSSGAKFVFTRDGGTQTLSFSGVTFGGGGFPVEVDNSTTLNMGTNVLRGSGVFMLKPGATLQTAHGAGLDSTLSNTGTTTLSTSASYIYNGTSAQVTGSIQPDTVSGIMINNSAGVTLTHSVVVNGTMEMKSGALSLGGNALSYGPEGVLKYSGLFTQTTTDNEFPVVGGPKNLTIANSSGTTLHASRSIAGNLGLSRRLTLGANTMTAATTSNANSANYVITNSTGVLKLTSMGSLQTLFPVAVVSGYAPVWITNAGTNDTIAVRVMDDTGPAAEGGRVKVKWSIEENTAGGGDYTLQFGWVDWLETSTFFAHRPDNAYIFHMVDTTQVGMGDYTRQFELLPYSIARGGITMLGPFAVGKFRTPVRIAAEADGMPDEFSLSQNYPNPFNPETTIDYSLKSESIVELIVYDVLGREVQTLVKGKMTSGRHSVRFKAGDLNSGVFYCRLRAGAFTQTKKLVLLR
jgi:endo-1,4-beta-xylanase